jgi:hypothetical protein
MATTIGKSNPAQQKENERALTQVVLLQKKIADLEKSHSEFDKKLVSLQLAVNDLQTKK